MVNHSLNAKPVVDPGYSSPVGNNPKNVNLAEDRQQEEKKSHLQAEYALKEPQNMVVHLQAEVMAEKSHQEEAKQHQPEGMAEHLQQDGQSRIR